MLLRAPSEMLPLLLTNTPLYMLPKKLIGAEKPSEKPALPLVGNDFSSPTPRSDAENAASGRTADISTRDSSVSSPAAALADARVRTALRAALEPCDSRPLRPT